MDRDHKDGLTGAILIEELVAVCGDSRDSGLDGAQEGETRNERKSHDEVRMTASKT